MGGRRWWWVAVGIVCVACSSVRGEEPGESTVDPRPGIEVFGVEVHGMGGPRGMAGVASGQIAVADFGAEFVPSHEIVHISTADADRGRRIRADSIAASAVARSGVAVEQLRPTVVWASPDGDVWFSALSANVIGRVSSIDGSSDMRVQTIRNGDAAGVDAPIDGPFTFAADQWGRVWFSNREGNSLGVIDVDRLDRASDDVDCSVADQCPIDRVELPGLLDEPVGIGLGPDVIGGPDADLWVTNWGDLNAITVVSPAPPTGGRPVEHIGAIAIDFDRSTPQLTLDADEPPETRSGPRAVAFVASVADGPVDSAWVVHHDSGRIVRFSLDSCRELPCDLDPAVMVSGARHPTAIVWNGGPDGDGHLYFTNRSAAWIGRLDPRAELIEVERMDFSDRCTVDEGGSAVIATDDGEVWFSSFSCQLIGRVVLDE